MNEQTLFYRKIAYGVAIAILLFPLSYVSAPATVTPSGRNPGGKLAQLREEYRLGQGDLGEIDPASETMKLATLGLRGVAMNLLWEKANYYKKTEDWSNLTATLEQLAKLQPNFVTFWKFQSWNLSYNVSVEFDDYRDRYYYVRRGIEFLKKGENYNRDNPHLLWDLGWFIGQKIGRADEHIQYRRLFKADDDFHPADRPPDQRDNWLVGKEWYLKAVDAVDVKGRSFGRKSPKVFFSSPSMSQMNYSEAIEKDGLFAKAQRAWARAEQEWREFGDRVIEHSTGVKLTLNDQERLEGEVARLQQELDDLMPGVRDTLAAEQREALSPEEQKALDTPYADRKPQQLDLAYDAERKLRVTHRQVGDRIARDQPDQENAALRLVGELERTERRLNYTVNYKRDANFDYWLTRAQFEQTPTAVKARELLFLGKRTFDEEYDLFKAKQRYDEGFAAWREVANEFPTLLNDDATTGDDLMIYIKEYREILDQLDESIPDDFPLWEVIENFDSEQDFVEELRAYKRGRGELSEDDLAEDDLAEDAASDASESGASDDLSNASTSNADSEEPDSEATDADQTGADEADVDEVKVDESDSDEVAPDAATSTDEAASEATQNEPDEPSDDESNGDGSAAAPAEEDAGENQDS